MMMSDEFDEQVNVFSVQVISPTTKQQDINIISPRNSAQEHGTTERKAVQYCIISCSANDHW